MADDVHLGELTLADLERVGIGPLDCRTAPADAAPENAVRAAVERGGVPRVWAWRTFPPWRS
jgi:hypothetical protein